MNSPSNDTVNSLVIQKNSSLSIENFQVEILAYLGQFTSDVYYFQVNILPTDTNITFNKLGLLRIGSIEGGLSRELKLREAIADYKLVAPLLAQTTVDSAIINLHSPDSENLPNLEKQEHEIESDQENHEHEIEANIP
jgi:PPM family protein phosphatase